MDFDMGKYGLFVWGAYGASALGLIGLSVISFRAHARNVAALKALTESLPVREPSATSPEEMTVQTKVAGNRAE